MGIINRFCSAFGQYIVAAFVYAGQFYYICHNSSYLFVCRKEKALIKGSGSLRPGLNKRAMERS